MEEKIRALKDKLQNIETRDLLGIHFMTFANDAMDFAIQSDMFNKTNLISPQKQYTYLAGLLMSTEDKSNGQITEMEENTIYSQLENDVQEITLEYTKTFLDFSQSSNTDDIKRNLVSMDAFISYFDTGILRYPEQTINLIRTLYSVFDSELEKLTGLRTEDYIAFYQLVCDEFENAISSSKYAIANMTEFLSSLNPYSDDVEKENESLIAFAQGSEGVNLQNAMDNLNIIKKSKVEEIFGKEKGTRLL